MAIPDEEFGQILHMLSNAGKIGIFLKDKTGVQHRFYKKDSELWCCRRDKDDNKTDHPVFKMSDVIKQQEQRKLSERAKSPFIQGIKQKLKEDYPDMEESEIDAYTDVIEHAGQTREKLMQMGLSKENADKLITATLSEQHPYAQSQIQREMTFGNLKRRNTESE